MLSIGEFSRVCKVTTRTLRHYDDIDLIKPIYVNEENGYRFYDVSQIKVMLFISRLKGYNFSLEEIKEILEVNDSEFTLRKIQSKEEEISLIINKFYDIEKQMKDDISRLKKGFDIMSFVDEMEVKVYETEDINVVYSRQHMSAKEYGKYIGKVFEKIAKDKLTVMGAPMSIYYDEEFNEDNNDTEVAVPVKESTEDTRVLKGTLCAVLRYKGPYSSLSNGYGRILQWIDENDYVIYGHPYEKYIKGPMDGGEIIYSIVINSRNFVFCCFVFFNILSCLVVFIIYE